MSGGPLYSYTLGNRDGEGALLFLNATGLNASSYRPLLEQVNFQGPVTALSMRGHGKTELPADPEALQSWQLFADDAAQHWQAIKGPGPLVLAGHSAGAVTALLTARALKPDLLLMIEPVVLPRISVLVARSPLKPWTVMRAPIVRKTLQRRSHFASAEEAAETYRKRSFFASWHPEAFAGYLEEGLKPAPGGGVDLSCAPAYEAACFGAQSSGFWPHLAAVVAQGTKVHVFLASKGSTAPSARGRARLKAYGASTAVFEGGHMLPTEEPAKAAAWMNGVLKEAGLNAASDQQTIDQRPAAVDTPA